ncbi:MAG: hypothetical protein KF813_02590 [Trueperaceae bacterium]|nr:hypothetical protein [Trueperaceae bacterium]
MTEQDTPRDRRSEIAEAGIRLIASRGVRSLTHRAIDSELNLAPGSTSYYARTRHDLVTLIVKRLAARTTLEMDAARLPSSLTPAQAAAIVAAGLDAMLLRAEDHLTRFALLIEFRNDPAMLAALAGDPPMRPRLIAAAEGLLARLGIDDAAEHAPDLVALVDGLLMQRVVRSPAFDARKVVEAFLTGLKASGADPSHRDAAAV